MVSNFCGNFAFLDEQGDQGRVGDFFFDLEIGPGHEPIIKGTAALW